MKIRHDRAHLGLILSDQPCVRYAEYVGDHGGAEQPACPDDLLSAANEAARADGVTTEELAADALRRYLAHRKLEDLGKYGRDQSSRLGYAEADVPGLIADSRCDNRGR